MSRSQLMARTLAQGEIRSTEGLPVVNPHAAGADIGAEAIYVCVPGPGQTQIVRTFGTYTADLHAIADWLVENGIQTIAMESTGVYWIPLFEVLEGRGIYCCLISGNLARRLPARHKTDVLDCQPALAARPGWIQTLHSLGLLTASFRPAADLVALRSLLRHRAQRIEPRSPHVLHMQPIGGLWPKALIHMNIRLDQAVSDPSGDTGLRIIRAIPSLRSGQAWPANVIPTDSLPYVIPSVRRVKGRSPRPSPAPFGRLRAGLAEGAPLCAQASAGTL